MVSIIMWIILFVIYGFLAFVMISFAYGGISAAPWVPLWRRDIERIIVLADLKDGQILYDLGAGDGRIILAAAKTKAIRAIGFEVAILPYLIGWCKILLTKKTGSVDLQFRNFFKQNLGDADVICCFLTPPAMRKLEPKLDRELKTGAKIFSYAFPLPNWQPIVVDKPDPNRAKIYVYQKK